MDAVRAGRKRRRTANGTKKRKRRPALVDQSVARLLTGEEDTPDQTVAPATVSDTPAVPVATTSSGTQPTENTLNGTDVPESSTEQSSSSGSDDDDTAPAASDAKPVPVAGASGIDKKGDVPNLNVIVLLEGANLETIKVPGRTSGLALLNSDDHVHILRKTKRNANDARPDILHQCLLTLLDSPLNKAGRLKVYVRSARNVLIEVHAQTRIPRTARRFYGLMAELLVKFKVRGTAGSQPLLRVVRNPITSHLPVGTRRVVCTYNCENIVDVRDHAANIAKLAPTAPKPDVGGDELAAKAPPQTVLYVVGAVAHGKISEDWAEENICISEYPLSAATVCSRITYAYECLLGIL